MHICLRLLQNHPLKSYTAINTRIKNTMNIIFGKYLFVTNTLSCGILMAGGDVIQQQIEKMGKAEKEFDWKRTGRMFVVGLAQGPPQHIFYKLLDKLLPRRDFKSISKKIILDQFVASPVCIVIFFLGMGSLEGHCWNEIVSESKRKFPTVYMVDWMVWPPTQVINFYFLSPKYRVTYINIMTMIYDVFLSYIKHDF